jgi:signal transduction histidine kinase
VRHDLRGTVGPMRMAVQLLRMGKVDAVEREEALQVIDRQIEALLAAIEDVGELLRAENGGFVRDATHQDANLLLDIVCGRCALIRGLAERQLRLRCDPCEAEALVGHDPARVAALLEFLLLRAAAHAPPGSELLLSLRQGEATSVHVSGAGASLGSDPELLQLLDAADARDEPSLRALLMREILHAGAIELRQDGAGALSLQFATGAG